MHFHVVTPSYNQLDFLKRAIASVADQIAPEAEQTEDSLRPRGACAPAGGPLPARISLQLGERTADSSLLMAKSSITVHHHIQDGGSTDGTVEFLQEFVAQQRTTNNYHLTFASEADEGMYDAINRGWLSAVDQIDRESEDPLTSDLRPPTSNPARECVLAHLNCDEQYLPGALIKIADFFSKHRNFDVVLADMIVVNNDGEYICHRRSLKPNRLLSRICCVGMTTTTFHRASVVRDRKVLFDTSWRNIGDMVWYNALHAAGVRFGVCNELVSIFVDTGENLNLTEEAVRERRRYADEYLWGMRRISRLMSKFYSLRRYLKEFYLKPPTEYALYWNDLTKRDVHSIQKPTGLWHRSGPKED